MDVILLRHGTRNFTMGDVPLNEIGLEQAQDLKRDSLLLKSTHIYSSPKKRARMTVEPLSEATQHPTIIIESLDQMMSHESDNEFRSRIQSFIEKLSAHEASDFITLCSHSDWLTVALEVIPTDAINIRHYMFACAEYVHFKVTDGLWAIQD